jgi:hypothetical protein
MRDTLSDVLAALVAQGAAPSVIEGLKPAVQNRNSQLREHVARFLVKAVTLPGAQNGRVSLCPCFSSS